jgi:hypothetical protein
MLALATAAIGTALSILLHRLYQKSIKNKTHNKQKSPAA